jgi:hypothetical protein
MTGPFIHVATYRLKEGKLDGFRQFLQESHQVFQAGAPGALAVNAYADEDGTEATIVQVHPDAASFEQHTRVAHERSFGQFVDGITSIQVYGEPSEHVLEVARGHAKAGIAVSVEPEHLGGFNRLEAAVD